jgi:hypothetical protein
MALPVNHDVAGCFLLFCFFGLGDGFPKRGPDLDFFVTILFRFYEPVRVAGVY